VNGYKLDFSATVPVVGKGESVTYFHTTVDFDGYVERNGAAAVPRFFLVVETRVFEDLQHLVEVATNFCFIPICQNDPMITCIGKDLFLLAGQVFEEYELFFAWKSHGRAPFTGCVVCVFCLHYKYTVGK
jgi:hypothetical protein